MRMEILTLTPDPVRLSEVMRYAGGGDPAAEEVARQCAAEAEAVLSYRVSLATSPLTVVGERVSCELFTADSRDLAHCLRGCAQVAVFAATVGIGIDRLIKKYAATSPVRALFMQSVGAERIEALCDGVCRLLRERYGRITPRFSPGYGDLPLQLQRDITEGLQCPQRLGLTLTDSLLMSPTKSVTAVCGICEESFSERI